MDVQVDEARGDDQAGAVFNGDVRSYCNIGPYFRNQAICSNKEIPDKVCIRRRIYNPSAA